MNDEPKIILSLTTYPKRFEFLLIALNSILNQTYYSKVDTFYINIDDNLTNEDYEKYNSLKKLSDKIQIKICPAKWRSCNKLIWVYKDHPNDIIVCFDDDKNYPKECLQQLYDKWLENKNCIISQEINPVVIDGINHISYLNTVDLMLLQREFGKYFSNGCLFCPRAFSEMLFDYDEMTAMTDGNHDELWFWLVSTLNNVQCIGLNYTFSYQLDECVCLGESDSDLTNINNQQERIKSYNNRISAKYGKQLSDILLNTPTVFEISENNILGLLGNAEMFAFLYGTVYVQLKLSVAKSWQTALKSKLSKYKFLKLEFI